MLSFSKISQKEILANREKYLGKVVIVETISSHKYLGLCSNYTADGLRLDVDKETCGLEYQFSNSALFMLDNIRRVTLAECSPFHCSLHVAARKLDHYEFSPSMYYEEVAKVYKKCGKILPE
jgi:hypothetical protein